MDTNPTPSPYAPGGSVPAAQPYAVTGFTPIPPPPRKSHAGRILAILAAAVVLLAAVAVVLGLALRHGPAAPTGQQQAITACEDAVKSQLKAPATAKFSGETTSPSGSGFHVEGSVDAENGFGALIRTPWECNAGPTANGSWLGNATIQDDN